MANHSMRQASSHTRRNRRLSAILDQHPATVYTDTEQPLLADKEVAIDDANGLKVILWNPLNSMLVFVVLGTVSHFASWGSGTTFCLNFLALIPLANILGDATEELATGLKNETLGGLLNATFGNAVEMIITLQTLAQGLIPVVKGALLGSILSNLLLVLGMSFFLGGIGKKGKEQLFHETGPMVNISMLFLACVGFCLPTVFKSSLETNPDISAAAAADIILKVSRVASIFILSSYIAFLCFQLWTHNCVFENSGEDSEEATISVRTSLLLLLISTLLVSLNSEFLVSSITGVVEEWNISQNFIGVILIPIVGNACEHASAIRMCIMDKPIIAIGIAVGSSTQIALFVVPFSVLLGWMMGVDMNLDFGALNAVILVLSVIICMSILVDGKSNWLEGYMLQLTYLIVAIVYWYDPSH